MMRRCVTYLLVACFVLMGTGSLQAMHRWQHAHEDSVGDRQGGQHQRLPDESNCPVCVQLHQPLHSAVVAPVVVVLGLTLDFSCIAPLGRVIGPAVLRVDCRGPPPMLVVLD
jgi:hypothetical protein